MELSPSAVAPRYAQVLGLCTPYLVTWPGNLDALNLAPFGETIQAEHIYDPTRLNSRSLIDGLHHLDAFSFGGQEMLMPRWVLFDCGEFPGIVFGFGRTARHLGPDLRRAYRVDRPDLDDVFVPLSMWVAIRCAEPGAWFGHNLSSCNFVTTTEALPGIGTLTKIYGIQVARAQKQYGATQWSSGSIALHLSLGEMMLLGAYTHAHTHEETFTYRIDVDAHRLVAPLLPGWAGPPGGGDRHIDADDSIAIRGLHDDIEAGAKLRLARVEPRGSGPATQRLWVQTLH